jgi:hypothetical protein
MAVPDYQSFMLPLLQMDADGEEHRDLARKILHKAYRDWELLREACVPFMWANEWAGWEERKAEGVPCWYGRPPSPDIRSGI